MIITWNVRGLNDPLKQAAVKKLLLTKKISLPGVLEPRVRSDNLDKVWNSFRLDQWTLITNKAQERVARIWLMFDTSKASVQILDTQDQCIHSVKEWFSYGL